MATVCKTWEKACSVLASRLGVEYVADCLPDVEYDNINDLTDGKVVLSDDDKEMLESLREQHRMSDDLLFPGEVDPLAEYLQGLIEQNEAGLFEMLSSYSKFGDGALSVADVINDLLRQAKSDVRVMTKQEMVNVNGTPTPRLSVELLQNGNTIEVEKDAACGS